jgi:hypothetical protein
MNNNEFSKAAKHGAVALLLGSVCMPAFMVSQAKADLNTDRIGGSLLSNYGQRGGNDSLYYQSRLSSRQLIIRRRANCSIWNTDRNLAVSGALSRNILRSVVSILQCNPS